MTTQRKLEIFAFVAVVLLGTLFLRSWILSDQEMRRAQTETADANKLVASADIAISERDAAATRAEKQLDAQAAAVRTPQQAAQVIVRYLPAPAPGQPATVAPPTVDRAQLSPELQRSLPDAPSFTLLTPAQAEAIARNDLQCDADRHTLAACQADTADLHTEVAARTAEAASWQAAAKGGTRWRRFGQALKLTACAAGGAGAAHFLKPTAAGAAVGAAAGTVTCSLF